MSSQPTLLANATQSPTFRQGPVVDSLPDICFLCRWPFFGFVFLEWEMGCESTVDMTEILYSTYRLTLRLRGTTISVSSRSERLLLESSEYWSSLNCSLFFCSGCIMAIIMVSVARRDVQPRPFEGQKVTKIGEGLRGELRSTFTTFRGSVTVFRHSVYLITGRVIRNCRYLANVAIKSPLGEHCCG